MVEFHQAFCWHLSYILWLLLALSTRDFGQQGAKALDAAFKRNSDSLVDNLFS
jgi:hypothetical protein